MSVRSARGRYQPRTAPRLLAAERQVACGTKPEQQLECTACAAHTTRPHFREACGPEGPPSRAVFPTLLAVWKVTADLATTGRASGKEEASRPPPPLRTGRASFPASGSSSLQPSRVTADSHGKACAIAILTILDPSLPSIWHKLSSRHAALERPSGRGDIAKLASTSASGTIDE